MDAHINCIADLQKALVGRADYHYAGAFIGLFTFSLLMYYVTCFIDPGYVRTSHHRRNEVSTLALVMTFSSHSLPVWCLHIMERTIEYSLADRYGMKC